MRSVVSSAIAIVLITALFGFAYPLAMTAFGQVAFTGRSNGSLITVDGKVVGSKLAAQGFSGPRYFHERPSATSPAYDAGATTFANLGPTNRTLAQNVRSEVAAILKRERPYDPGLTVHDIPVDAVTTSGSGIDPEISPAYAQLQERRIAAVRHLPLATVRSLVARYTTRRSWGFFGEPGVNVLELNLALDRRA